MKLSCGQSLAALADVAHVRVGQQVRELLLRVRREEPFVHAHVHEAGLEELLVGLVGHLLVVHAPGILADLLVGVVADRVALERVGLQLADGLIDRLQPAWLSRREDGVAEHPAGAGFLALTLARASAFISLVRNQSCGMSEGEPGDESDLGVAVEIDLLEVVGELKILDGLGLADQRRIPPRLADPLALRARRP